jgi:hypothetical protein
MRRTGFRILAGLIGVLVLPSCVNSEVTYTGKNTYPARAEGCSVNIFPSTTPDYGWEDLATVRSSCSLGRSDCIEELKRKTCELGGDTLYGFKDGMVGDVSVVIGTVALKTGEAQKKVGETAPKQEPAAPAPAPVAVQCSPPCSPGYECQGTTCIALCNPACGPGMTCNQQRMCEPTTQAAPATSPAQ